MRKRKMMPKQPENSCQWLAAIHPTFLHLIVWKLSDKKITFLLEQGLMTKYGRGEGL
jgi:hypothetical protein